MLDLSSTVSHDNCLSFERDVLVVLLAGCYQHLAISEHSNVDYSMLGIEHLPLFNRFIHKLALHVVQKMVADVVHEHANHR